MRSIRPEAFGEPRLQRAQPPLNSNLPTLQAHEARCNGLEPIDRSFQPAQPLVDRAGIVQGRVLGSIVAHGPPATKLPVVPQLEGLTSAFAQAVSVCRRTVARPKGRGLRDTSPSRGMSRRNSSITAARLRANVGASGPVIVESPNCGKLTGYSLYVLDFLYRTKQELCQGTFSSTLDFYA